MVQQPRDVVHLLRRNMDNDDLYINKVMATRLE